MVDGGGGWGGWGSRRWVGRRTIIIVAPGVGVGVAVVVVVVVVIVIIVVVVVVVVVGGVVGVVPTCVLSTSAMVVVGIVMATRASASEVRVGVLVSCVGPLAVVGLIPAVGAVALALVMAA